MNTSRDIDAAVEYATAVEQESQAWHALQLHGPGTPGRAAAWKTWSEAISQTNRAWRRANSPAARADDAHHAGR